MNNTKKILTVGVTGALLLSISGAVSPLNNSLASNQELTSGNVNTDLEKEKEQAIKKLEEYPEAFDKSLNSLAEELKKAKIEQIKKATKKEEIQKILDEVKNAHNLNKAKKEGKNFVDGLKHINEQQKVELRNMIGNMKKLEELMPFLKDEAVKELDDFTSAFNEKLYGKALADAMKSNIEAEINQAKDIDSLKAILDKVDKANEIGKAKEEGRKKVDEMKNLSPEEKVKAYNSIGSGETLEKVKEEVQKAQTQENAKENPQTPDQPDNTEKLANEKTQAIKDLDKFTNAFNEKLYGKVLANAMKENYKKQINEANSVEKINSIINTVKTADEIGKAKEEGRKKVDEMKNLSPEQKREAYNSIGSGANLEKVKESLNSAMELDKKQGSNSNVLPPMPNNPSETPAPAPEVKVGWKKDDAGTKYQKENGSFAKAEWEPVNGTWYHFDENGYMQTGWLNLDGTWYYLNADGSMAKDTWIGTYYVDASGAWVVEGWQQSGYGWWYQRANGTYPASEWEQINGIWYYFDANGYMLADTTTPDGYYVDANGAWVLSLIHI